MSRQKGFSSLAVLNGLPTFRTALRIKPLLERSIRRRRTVPVRGQQASYAVDCVLDAATQQQAYQHLCAPLVVGLLNGESSMLLFYGASQTGKSYTLQGSDSSDCSGIVVQAVHAVLRGLSIVPKAKYRLSCSYCGLGVGHESRLVDLLAATPAAAATLRDASAAAAMAVLSSWTIEECVDILEVLKCRRTVHASASGGFRHGRSMHTMLTVQLDSFDADKKVVSSKYISFVELAAPEAKDPLGMGRSTETASGRSLAMTYNSLSKVLLALRNSAPSTAAAPGPVGAAAAALASGSQTGLQQLQHVPWRDSALTRWLQERLHAAQAITVVGTVSAAAEAAADTLATISWVSRFSAASRSGAGGTLVNFAWDMASDSEASGSYMRYQLNDQVIRDPEFDRSQYNKQKIRQRELQLKGSDSPVRQRAFTPTSMSCFEPACSSPMVNQCSPDLPGSTAPRSAASVSNVTRPASRWQQQLLQEQQQSLDSMPMKHHVQQWQQQQEQMQSRADAAAPAGRAAGAVGFAEAANDTKPCSDTGRVLAEEVVLYGELMTALRRAAGGVRAEAILEKLLQDLGAARAALGAECKEADTLRADLASFRDQHADCNQTRKLLQDHNRELEQQLLLVQKGLDEAAADRDLFLKRLQQLEADHDATDKSPSRQELQRQQAHAEQLRTMEAELSALASSNQQLRSQLELVTQQMSRSKSAAQSAADGSDQLQQEVDVLRSAADIEGEIRRELEASIEQLQRACEATAHELASATADKAALQQTSWQSQESIDALAGELQETLARLADKETQVEVLVEELEAEQAANKVAEQKMSSLQAQMSALEEMTQQLQQQKHEAADGQVKQQQTAESLQRTLEELQAALAKFEQDIEAVAPQLQNQLLHNSSKGQLRSAFANSRQSRVTHSLMQLSSSRSSNMHRSPAHSAIVAADNDAGLQNSQLAGHWAQKLQAVVELVHAVTDEASCTADKLQGGIRRAELLERNVDELRKLVATQEDLQQQLASQLAASQQDAGTAAEQHQAAQQRLQASLDEAQIAVTALAEELQECQSSLKAAQGSVAERDQALDVLADEFVELSAAHESLGSSKQEVEQQVLALAADLEEALLQLRVREQVLDQVWGQLKGSPQHKDDVAGNCQALAQTITGSDSRNSWQAGGGTEDVFQTRSAALENLYHQQQLQQQQKQKQGLQQKQKQNIKLDAGGGKGPAAAIGLAQQAVRAARRRSLGGDMDATQDTADSAALMPHPPDRACTGDQDSLQQQQQHPDQARLMGLKQLNLQLGRQLEGTRSSEQVQPLVVAAVQQLRSQVVDLQQQLAEAEATRQESSRLQQQLRELQQQHGQLLESCDLQGRDNLTLQTKCRQLGQQLRAKELEAAQAQERCQELVDSLKQVQQHLQQQQHAPPAAPSTPSLAQQQTELQLIDCRHQLADTQAQLAVTTAALKAERTARVAAEDAEAVRQQLLGKLHTLQQEQTGLHAQLLAERKQVAGLREELALMATSRDTWRDSAKKAEAAAAAAETAAETKTTDLTRARAELHAVRQQVANVTQQLELQQLQGIVQKSSELGAADGLAEGLAARLAAAQVMRREAEEKAADAGRKLAAAEKRLEELQQQQQQQQRAGDVEQMQGRMSIQEAQVARSKADAAAQQAPAEGAAGQLADVTRQLITVQAERDKLQQQLVHLQGQNIQISMLQQDQQVDGQRPQQQQQQQQQQDVMSGEAWSNLTTPVTYEGMMAPLVNGVTATTSDGVRLQQHWLQGPQISSNNPFYQLQSDSAAAANSCKVQHHVGPQHRDTLGSAERALDAGSPNGVGFRLSGLFPGWRSKSGPGVTVAADGGGIGVGTPVAAEISHSRMTYSSSRGGGSPLRLSAAGGGAVGQKGSSNLAVAAVGGGGEEWGSGTGAQEQTPGVVSSQHVTEAAESPCLY